MADDTLPGGPLTARALDAFMERHVPPPEVVCHYTSVASARAILKSGGLWASGIQHLNDATEWFYARDLAAALLEATPCRAPWELALRSLCRDLIMSDLADTTFVASMTRLVDDLSQWRAYGDDAQGICLEFNCRALFDACAVNGFLLMPVTYDPGEQRALLEALVGDSWASAQQHHSTEVMARDFASSVLALAPFLKNPHFHAEAEWRGMGVVPNGAQRVFRRERGGQQVPTVTLDLGSATSLRLRTGPKSLRSASQDLVAQSVLTVTECLDSAIPLR